MSECKDKDIDRFGICVGDTPGCRWCLTYKDLRGKIWVCNGHEIALIRSSKLPWRDAPIACIISPKLSLKYLNYIVKATSLHRWIFVDPSTIRQLNAASHIHVPVKDFNKWKQRRECK